MPMSPQTHMKPYQARLITMSVFVWKLYLPNEESRDKVEARARVLEGNCAGSEASRQVRQQRGQRLRE